MARNRTKENVSSNKEDALTLIDSFLEDLINSNDEKLLKRADLISYWLKSFTHFAKSEDTFNPKYLLKYKRGDVVKVDFGYRCKNELGGLHYAIVLDISNAKSSGLITVVPLSSKKPNKAMHHSEVDLGTELFSSLMSACDKLRNSLAARINDPSCYQLNDNSIETDFKNLDKKQKEILKMKSGSIAMVGHISTISKVRIMDPITKHGSSLCDVSVSTSALDLIDSKLLELFIKKK